MARLFQPLLKQIEIYTDSIYVKDGITKVLESCKKNNISSGFHVIESDPNLSLLDSTHCAETNPTTCGASTEYFFDNFFNTSIWV